MQLTVQNNVLTFQSFTRVLSVVNSFLFTTVVICIWHVVDVLINLLTVYRTTL